MTRNILERPKGGSYGAMCRLSHYYPKEYTRVMEVRTAREAAYRLDANNFDRILRVALRQLVNEGICKKPKLMK